ncbi:hypothetical protein FP2506_03324 [Fulvimarina pelagi HTCC2506]|uniref:Uncharacterized protein n=2 Tax=Fulvimarina pelagi TaxID=217511 RepID=Q0G068_9HYPH|nr:hypothetical protein [Fulvimarina pelagi]EAU40725.1 hypothetical protein FP2506_03324 [Fulvimarina pelagi HTCC2506]BAT31267.1 hypothetical protein [Fulvimarina pelagi]
MDPDLIAELRPIRLPPGFEAFDLSGTLAVFSIAVLAGLALALMLRLATEPKPSIRRAVTEKLEAAKALQPGDRLLAQAQALGLLETSFARKRRKPKIDAFDLIGRLKTEISEAIYRREPGLDCDRIDRDILALTRTGRA